MPQGAGLAPVLIKRASTVELGWNQRHTSGFDAKDSAGRVLHVALPHGTVVRGSDVLVGEDGSLVRVVAKTQSLLKITLCSHHGTALDLIRAAYHLGQRQVAVELQSDCLKIAPDAVLADQLRAMHLIVTPIEEAFEPEYLAVALQDGSTHTDPATAKPKAPSRLSAIAIAAVSTPHVHGPGCGHGHSHG